MAQATVFCTLFACGKVYDGDEAATNNNNNNVDSGVATGDGSGSTTDSGSSLPDTGFFAEASTNFCLTHPAKFCDDFDDDGGLGSKWPVQTVSDGGASFDTTGTGASSPPAAVVFTKVKGTDQSFRRDFPGSFSSATFEADMMLVAKPTVASRVVFMDLAFVSQAHEPNWHLRFGHSGGAIEISEVEFGSDASDPYRFVTKDVSLLPLNKWVRISIKITTGNGKHGVISIDNQIIFDEPFTYLWNPDDSAEINIGAFASFGSNGNWAVRFDNVTANLQ